MTITGVLALLVMSAATGGMFWAFLKINEDNSKSQDKSDQFLDKCDQMLGKFDQLIVLLTAAIAISRPAEKRPAGRRGTRKMAETATTSEPKGGDGSGDGI